MTISQVLFGAALVPGLLLAAGLFAWKQRRLLKRLGAPDQDVGQEEQLYLRKQAVRRLICSALMTVLAILLTVALLFLEDPAQRLADQAPGGDLTPEQKQFVRLYSYFWIVLLLVLFAMLVLAALDYRATRHYGLQQYQRIQTERRALIHQELEHLRNRSSGM